MEIHIDQNVLDMFSNLHITSENDIIIVKIDEDNSKLPMTNLNHLSWQKIDEIGKSGKAREYFTLGATKTDHMKNGFDAVYQIIGFDHDDLADGSGKAAITWDMVGLYKEEKAMCKNNDSVWWSDTDMRTFLNGDFKEFVSDDLASIVKPVIKYSKNRAGSLKETVDKIWLKSEQELFGRKIWSYGGEGKWYEFYAQENIAYFKLMPNGERNWQWLRSVHAAYSSYFCFVNTSGNATSYNAYYSLGFAPAFCS